MSSNNNDNCVEVMFDYPVSNLMADVQSDSSYIASSLYGMAAEKSSVMPIIVTDDESDYVKDALARAYNAIATRVAAYLSPSSESSNTQCTIGLLLPTVRHQAVDGLIEHELRRAFVTYVLAQWYECKIPDVARRQWQLYEAAMSMAMHDIFMAYGGMKRGCSYF